MWGKQDPAHVARLAEQGLSFAPPAAWVTEREIPSSDGPAQGSIQFLMSDTQIDLTNGRDWTYRLVQRALNADGVGRMASFNTAYDPSCERITVHRIRVVRGTEVIELADPDSFQLLRREANLERRLYDGRLTVDLQIPDLRPGDLLDTWYTTHGVTPAIRDHLDARFTFEWGDPVSLGAVRVRAPERRSFAIRSLPTSWAAPTFSETRPSEGIIDREWIDKRGGVFRYDDSVPEWWQGHGRIEMADNKSWSDIADIFRDAYAAPAELSDSFRAGIAHIASTAATPAARTIAALRHVQREIRYLSVSIGEGGHIPRPVDEIWARRFGDCKDVSRLLCTMLRALDIDATPALVNTRVGASLDKQLPGVHAFDHCIVRVRISRRTYWLDATYGEQGGDLEHIFQPSLGWALPLEANAKLERMEGANNALHGLDITENFVFGPRPSSPAELHVEGVYRGWRADSIRSAIRRDGLDRTSESWLKHYARCYGGASVLESPKIEDDLDKNIFRLVERYRIDSPWNVTDNAARFTSVDDIFQRDLAILPYPGRTQPLYLGMPRRMTRKTMFKLPIKWTITPWSDRVDVPGIRGLSEFQVGDSSKLVLDIDYEITSQEVASEDLDDFRAAAEKLRGGTGISLTHGVKNGEFIKPGNSYSGNRGATIAVGIFLIVLVLARFLTSNQGG